jgi:hypothetical protein
MGMVYEIQSCAAGLDNSATVLRNEKDMCTFLMRVIELDREMGVALDGFTHHAHSLTIGQLVEMSRGVLCYKNAVLNNLNKGE